MLGNGAFLTYSKAVFFSKNKQHKEKHKHKLCSNSINSEISLNLVLASDQKFLQLNIMNSDQLPLIKKAEQI